MRESSVVTIRAWTITAGHMWSGRDRNVGISYKFTVFVQSQSFTAFPFTFLKSAFPLVTKIIMCFSHIDYIKFGLRLREFNFKLVENKFQKTHKDQQENIMELGPELTDFQPGDDTVRKEGTWSGKHQKSYEREPTEPPQRTDNIQKP